jgi:hypothetical protein
MHPILSSRGRLLAYLLLWVTFGGLLAGIIAVTNEASLQWGELFVMPLAVLMGLQCLPCWYLVRGMTPGEVPAWRMVGTWTGTSFVLLSLWLGAATVWLRVLKSFDHWNCVPLRARRRWASCAGSWIRTSCSTA